MSGKRNWPEKPRRDGKEPPPIFETTPKVPSKYWKALYECKRNKGDHTMAISNIHSYGWHQEKDGTWRQDNYRMGKTCYWVDWRCTACQKLKLEWEVPTKSFDKYRNG